MRAFARSGHIVSIRAALNGLTYAAGLISFLSVVRYVGIIYSFGFVSIFTAAFYFDYRGRLVISRSMLNLLLVVLIIFNSLRITTDNIAGPIVETLLILIAVKFLEEKKPRDYMQIYALSTFLLAGSALLTLDLQFLINLILLAFLLPLCIVLLAFFAQERDMTVTNAELTSVISKALLIPLVSIPMTALMFVILPRTGFPLLSFLNAGGGTTGFTDHVTLGDISNIQENQTVIFRAETEQMSESMLYWRGIVLDYFDGKSWRALDSAPEPRGNLKLTGKRVHQIIYLEPYGNKYLFALDKPLSVDYRGSQFFNDLSVRLRRDIDKRIKYTALSVLSDIKANDVFDESRYLQLPEEDLGKLRTQVRELTTGRNEEEAAYKILHYLRDGRFSYSLTNLPITDKPIEDFLFKYKYGNCEYFASAMAAMLRMAGIPSRLVGGYRGGYYNELGGYYLVTQSNAHVWVEAYIQNRGWVRMDPTPGSGSVLAESKSGVWFRVRLFFDAMNYYWNSMIIGYDLNKQISFFTGFRNAIKSPNINLAALKKSAAVIFAVLALIPVPWMLSRRAAQRKTPERKLINDFNKKMIKHGYKRNMSEGLQEFAGKIENPDLREKVRVFAAEMERMCYRDKVMTREDSARLKGLLDHI